MFWSLGPWCLGVLEFWRAGGLEGWRAGLEGRFGILWYSGVLVCCCVLPSNSTSGSNPKAASPNTYQHQGGTDVVRTRQ